MQFEARGILDELAQSVVKDSIEIVKEYYSELPREARFAIAVERSEGKLDGIYSFWLLANDEERHDDAVDTINDLVSPYHELIQQTV